ERLGNPAAALVLVLGRVVALRDRLQEELERLLVLLAGGLRLDARVAVVQVLHRLLEVPVAFGDQAGDLLVGAVGHPDRRDFGRGPGIRDADRRLGGTGGLGGGRKMGVGGAVGVGPRRGLAGGGGGGGRALLD